MPKLVILAGNSCVGKGPLKAALDKFRPDLAQRLQPLILYNSRAARPTEVDGVDYHFRPRAVIEQFRGDPNYLVMDVRGDLQALDLRELARLLRHGDAFFEGNAYVGAALLDCPLPRGATRLAVFLAPLCRDELVELKAAGVDLDEFIAAVMRCKLLRRMTKQRERLGLPDLQEVERRATSAAKELRLACRFQHVIPNHDAEGSENWDLFYHPIGDARRALRVFAALLQDLPTLHAEKWEDGLL